MSIGELKLTEGTEQVQRDTPAVSLVLAYAATIPLATAAGAVLLAPRAWHAPVSRFGSIWAGAVLSFLAGVRRGYRRCRAGRSPAAA